MLDFTLRQVEKKARARGMCMCEWELDRLEGGDVVGFGWGRGCEREGGRDGLRGLGSVLSETMGWGGEGSGGRVVVMDLFREISALLRWGCRCRGCT